MDILHSYLLLKHNNSKHKLDSPIPTPRTGVAKMMITISTSITVKRFYTTIETSKINMLARILHSIHHDDILSSLCITDGMGAFIALS